MSKRQRKSIALETEKWLSRFSDLVDYRRFEKGMRLYHEKGLSSFSWTKHGFQAFIQGTAHQPYEITGRFIMARLLPDLTTYEVHCTCPDDVPFCKHVVCATFHMMLSFDPFISKIENAQAAFQQTSKGKQLIHDLEKKIEDVKYSIDVLPKNTVITQELLTISNIISDLHAQVKK